MLEHDTGDRDSGSAQSPSTLVEASVTLLMTVLLNLGSQAGEQKETMEPCSGGGRASFCVCVVLGD